MTSITETLTNLAEQYFGTRFESIEFGYMPGKPVTGSSVPVWYVTCKPILGVAQRTNLGMSAEQAERALRLRIANAEKCNRLAKMHVDNEAMKRAPGYTAGFYAESGLPRDPEAFNAAVAEAELKRIAADWTPGGAPDMSEMDEDERAELLAEQAAIAAAERAAFEHNEEADIEPDPAEEILSIIAEHDAAERESLLSEGAYMDALEAKAEQAPAVDTTAEYRVSVDLSLTVETYETDKAPSVQIFDDLGNLLAAFTGDETRAERAEAYLLGFVDGHYANHNDRLSLFANDLLGIIEVHGNGGLLATFRNTRLGKFEALAYKRGFNLGRLDPRSALSAMLKGQPGPEMFH